MDQLDANQCSPILFVEYVKFIGDIPELENGGVPHGSDFVRFQMLVGSFESAEHERTQHAIANN